MNLSPTALKALEAYGGQELWMKARGIEARVSVEGLAFTLKGRPFFTHAAISQSIQSPVSRLQPIGHRPDIAGVLDGGDVRLEEAQGNVVAARNGARSFFTLGRRLLWWDDLDMAYFANYAFWNYFTLPALLCNPAILWQERARGILDARFPEGFPTHNREQRFTFELQSGLLRQHDYTAEIISPLARAANVVVRHATNADGLVYPAERLVTPRLPDGRPLGWPVLIHIVVHEFRLMVDG